MKKKAKISDRKSLSTSKQTPIELENIEIQKRPLVRKNEIYKNILNKKTSDKITYNNEGRYQVPAKSPILKNLKVEKILDMDSLKDKYKKALVLGFGGPEGLYTNMRGEGRWSSNVALLFRKFGMEVHTVTNGSIVDDYKDKQSDIKFLKTYEELDTDYDLFFKFSPFYKDDPVAWTNIFRPRVKKALFGNFWPSVHDKRPFAGGMLVSPYRSFSDECGVLPYMYIDEFGESKFDNQTLVWTNRGPFNTSMGEQRVIVNLFHLRETLVLAKEGFRVIFLCYGKDFIYEDQNFKFQDTNILLEIKKLVEELKGLKNVEFYSYLRQDEFDDILKEGSVAVRCDASGSFSACLSYGLVPTVFTPWFWPVYFNKTEIQGLKFYGDYNKVEEYFVKDKLRKLLTDKSYYNNELSLLRDNVPIFTTSQAMTNLVNILSAL